MLNKFNNIISSDYITFKNKGDIFYGMEIFNKSNNKLSINIEKNKNIIDKKQSEKSLYTNYFLEKSVVYFYDNKYSVSDFQPQLTIDYIYNLSKSFDINFNLGFMPLLKENQISVNGIMIPLEIGLSYKLSDKIKLIPGIDYSLLNIKPYNNYSKTENKFGLGCHFKIKIGSDNKSWFIKTSYKDIDSITLKTISLGVSTNF
jgi:hypothetical protein